jgi:hypothetical protein
MTTTSRRPGGDGVAASDEPARDVVVSFVLEATADMGRQRISVWTDHGAPLCPPSAQSPPDVVVSEGASFFVEASVPCATKRGGRTREEQRWQLRASPESIAVLKLGSAPAYGLSSAIEIRVQGAVQVGAPQNPAVQARFRARGERRAPGVR